MLATPPPAFVAARNALVKTLRAAKDRESATAVAGIRRPAWPEWALNVTSRSHPDEVAAFADAAETVRAAQEAAIEGRPADVRQALRELRDRTAAVIAPANAALHAEDHGDETPELQARLSDIAGRADAVDDLCRGITGTGGAGGDELFAGLEPAPRPRPTAPSSAPRGRRSPTPRAEDPPAPDAAERRRLMRARADADRALQRSRRAARQAEEAVGAARHAAEQAAQRLAEAQEHLAEATDVVRRDEAARAEASAALDATS